MIQKIREQLNGSARTIAMFTAVGLTAFIIVVGWGVAFGRIGQKVDDSIEVGKAAEVSAQRNKDVIHLIDKRMSYQDGVVTTKLEGLEKGQIRIERGMQTLMENLELADGNR